MRRDIPKYYSKVPNAIPLKKAGLIMEKPHEAPWVFSIISPAVLEEMNYWNFTINGILLWNFC